MEACERRIKALRLSLKYIARAYAAAPETLRSLAIEAIADDDGRATHPEGRAVRGVRLARVKILEDRYGT